MSYIPPNQRKKKAAPSPQPIPIAVCKWCHESGHLSINCKYKGTILDRKPDLDSGSDFPSLNNTPESINTTPIWGNKLDVESLKETLINHEKESLKRIHSSNVSLDTLTSATEQELDNVDELVYHNNIILKDIHPYESFYKHQMDTNPYNKAFYEWWLIYLPSVDPSSEDCNMRVQEIDIEDKNESTMKLFKNPRDKLYKTQL